jgi:opacity protein-like surface antigen
MKNSGRVSSAQGIIGLLLGTLLFLVSPGFSQQKTWSRFEFEIVGGSGLTQFEDSSRYAREWGFKYIEQVKELTDLSMKAENPIPFRAGFSYFFTPLVGIQLGGGYFSSNLYASGSFNFQVKWKGDPEVSDHSETWSGSGKMRSIPLYLNLVGRFRTKIVDFCLTAGPTVYFNRFEAASSVGFCDLWYEEEWYRGSHFEYIGVESYIIPVKIPETSWTAFGGNAGIGIDFRMSPEVAIGVEGRYFLVPKKSLRWEWTPGTYPMLYNPDAVKEYSAEKIKEFQEIQTATKVKPSFFSISVGLKFAFGQR